MTEVKIGLIGGSGLGKVLAGQTEGKWHDIETPFGHPSGAIVETDWDGLPVFFLSRHGNGHTLNPTQVPYRANLFALKQLGVTHVIASGAVGSLRNEFRPRDLVIADQIIDKTNRRAGTFYEKAAVHVEFAEPFCPVLRRILSESAAETEAAGGDPAASPPIEGGSAEAAVGAQHAVHPRGCYVCMEGPAFSTRAESLVHRLWGGDLIGMTAMPEAKLAREAELGYALVALVTDYDCWRRTSGPFGPGQVQQTETPEADPAVLLKEIIANLQAASDNALRLIRRSVQRIAASAELRADLMRSPATDALRLAIWSDKAHIAAEEVARLGPLWGRYFANEADRA